MYEMFKQTKKEKKSKIMLYSKDTFYSNHFIANILLFSTCLCDSFSSIFDLVSTYYNQVKVES